MAIKNTGDQGKKEQTGVQPETSQATAQLAEKIAKMQSKRIVQSQKQQRSAGEYSGMARAIRLGSEFIAAILVGAGLGWVIDGWAGTRPWVMIVMLLVGFAAGVRNMLRTVEAMNKEAATAGDVVSDQSNDVDWDDEED